MRKKILALLAFSGGVGAMSSAWLAFFEATVWQERAVSVGIMLVGAVLVAVWGAMTTEED